MLQLAQRTIGRIALRGEPPRELLRLLPLIGLDPFGAGGLDSAMVAVFSRRDEGGWTLHARDGRESRLSWSVACATAEAAASALLGGVLAVDEPLLFADSAGFNVLRQALESGSSHMLITGEPGSGRRSLAGLIARLSASPDQVRSFDCADGAEFSRLLGIGGPDLPRPSGSLRGCRVILANIDRLPAASQEELARVIRARRHFVTYLATAASPSGAARLTETLVRPLLSLFKGRLAMPPLRARTVQIGALCELFLDSFNPRPRLAADAREALGALPFDHNVSELRNLILRLGLMAGRRTDRRITAADIAADCAVSSAAVTRALEPDEQPAASGRARVAAAGGSHLQLVASAERFAARRLP